MSAPVLNLLIPLPGLSKGHEQIALNFAPIRPVAKAAALFTAHAAWECAEYTQQSGRCQREM